MRASHPRKSFVQSRFWTINPRHGVSTSTKFYSLDFEGLFIRRPVQFNYLSYLTFSSVSKMLKRQLLRQARTCRALRASPSSLSGLIFNASPKPSASYKPAVLATSISRQIISRNYSSAAAAAEAQDGGNQSGLITRFADLSSLGVHPNILKSIVDDMGYESMTDVQSMSINPALQGKDM